MLWALGQQPGRGVPGERVSGCQAAHTLWAFPWQQLGQLAAGQALHEPLRGREAASCVLMREEARLEGVAHSGVSDTAGRRWKEAGGSQEGQAGLGQLKLISHPSRRVSWVQVQWFGAWL